LIAVDDYQSAGITVFGLKQKKLEFNFWLSLEVRKRYATIIGQTKLRPFSYIRKYGVHRKAAENAEAFFVGNEL